jgi:hypothetical protein
MSVNSTQVKGKIIVLICTLFLIYYSFWVLVTPFYHDQCTLHRSLPSKFPFRDEDCVSRAKIRDYNPSYNWCDIFDIDPGIPRDSLS